MKKQKPVVEPPKDQDHLEVYPEKKQVSAFPERRYIKTNRFLVIIALINLACILAGASIFIYSAQRVGVRVQNKNGLLLYQIDREEKQLKQAEYRERKISAKQLVMEDYLKKYIRERHSFHGTLSEFSSLYNEGSFIFRSSSAAMKDQIRRDYETLQRETLTQRRERDVHIYNIHHYHNNLWTAIIETFDFPEHNGPPVCDCTDNSKECLNCKYENTLLRQRRRVWIRAGFTSPESKAWNGWIRSKEEELLINKYDNPFGILVQGYYVGYMPKDALNSNWDLPPELR